MGVIFSRGSLPVGVVVKIVEQYFVFPGTTHTRHCCTSNIKQQWTSDAIIYFCVDKAGAEAETNGAAETNGTAEASSAVADGEAAGVGEKAKELSHEDQQSECWPVKPLDTCTR